MAKPAKAVSKGSGTTRNGGKTAAASKGKTAAKDAKDTKALAAVKGGAKKNDGSAAEDARWAAEAEEVEETHNPLNVPYDVFLQEAGGAGAFVDRRWEPSGNLPGLKRVRNRLPRTTGDEIRSLVHAVQHAQTALLLIVDPEVIHCGERARFVVDELESAIEFLLDDDVDEPADKQLAKLKEFHSQDGQRSTALAQSLRDYAALAGSLQDRLVEIDEDFDPALIQEAKALAKALAAPEQPEAPAGAAAGAALALRNRLLHLLVRRVALVRKTAARVFAHHPAILREVTSAYERRRRAAARRDKTKSPPAASKGNSKDAPKKDAPKDAPAEG